METIGSRKWASQQEQRIKAKLVEPGSVYIPPVKKWRPLGVNMTHGVRFVINTIPDKILD